MGDRLWWLANVASVTPGAVGIAQATTRSRSTAAATSPSTAVDYSTAQQLITTAWNVLFALVLVISVFGWTGGKQLVEQSYADAKVKVAEQKAEHAEKKAEKRAEREESGRGRAPSPPRQQGRRKMPSPAAGEGEPDVQRPRTGLRPVHRLAARASPACACSPCSFRGLPRAWP